MVHPVLQNQFNALADIFETKSGWVPGGGADASFKEMKKGGS
jgi:hypothetical protein